MPDCYLLAVAKDSSLDRDNNIWSLFNLVEQVQVEAKNDTSPMVLPLEIHAYWFSKPEEFDIEFEFRVVFVRGDKDIVWTDNVPLKFTTQRHRVRMRGVPLLEVGEYKLAVEWRRKDSEEWNRCSIFWPLVIEKLSPSFTKV